VIPGAARGGHERLVVNLAEAADPSRAGGKGHGLYSLLKLGFNVPPGFVVTSAAYRRAAAAAAVRAAIGTFESHAAPARVPSPQASAALERVRSAFIDTAIDVEVRAEIDAAWELLVESAPGEIVVACRSSAIGEDSRDASYAGQHATRLGLRDIAGVLRAIGECWASYWTDQAVAYRRRVGAGPLAMAVVVQRVIRAELSGVAFTVNPVTGDPGEVVVNSTYGLGESVVSGSVTPDTYVVRKSDGELLASEISESKSVMLEVGKSGGTVERAVEPALAAASSLSPGQLAEVVARAIEIESRSGSPQDIEWAIENGELFLLQARPVTTTSPRSGSRGL